MGLLEGKVAVVTGAGRGIGRATALLFAQHGARVVVNDASTARDGSAATEPVADAVVAEIVAAGGTAVASVENVATAHGAEALTNQALSAFGTIDVLVNNAGISRDGSLLKMSHTDWSAVLETGLSACFLCTQAMARPMKDQGGGCIINTTSAAGLLGNLGQANASAAHAGVYGLTRTAAIELQRYGIRVNAVAPLAKTRLTEDLPIFEQVESMQPEHVAPVHLFLASALSGDLTGVAVAVAGGRVSCYKLAESRGQFKESDQGIWTAEELAEHWDAISK